MSTSPPAGRPKSTLSSAWFLTYCVIVGVVAGCGAIAFFSLLEVSRFAFLEGLAGFHPPSPGGEDPLFSPSATPFRRWVLFLLPAVGGLASGILIYFLAPETAGHGTDAAIEAYHFRDGKVRARVPLVKALSSAITIGTGGSAGREGPIAQIGAGFASILGSRLGLSGPQRRTLMAAGMAGGIGAIFHAPLAGALFTAEVLYKDMDLEHEVLVPSFISSITAYSVFCLAFGWNPVFATPGFVFNDPSQLLPFAVLAVALALGAMVYVRFFYAVHRGFARLRIPNFLKPAVGGVLVGLVGLYAPRALGTGYGIVQQAIDHELTIPVLLGLALCKIATTAFAVGSGGSGGVFGPAIVIGGALGGAVGLIAERLMPAADIHAGAFAVVGMAGFFAAAANCPISTIIMVSEMTGNFNLLVPSMLVCILAYLLAKKYSLYEKQLPSRLQAPTKMGNMLSAVLREIEVTAALDVDEDGGPGRGLLTVPQNLTLGLLIGEFSRSHQACFPVVDDEENLVAVIDSEDIRAILAEGGLSTLIVAHDIAKPAVTIPRGENLLTAVQKMAGNQRNALVVVDVRNPSKPVATLGRDRIIQAYSNELFSADPALSLPR